MDNKSRKRKLSVVSAQHYFRLSYRLVLFGILLVVYIRDKMDHGGTLMDLMDSYPVIIVLIWIIFTVEMVQRFIPSPTESPGCQKQFARNYIKSGSTDIAIQENNASVLVALVWVLFNGIFGALYMAEILDDGIMILLCCAYSVCDVICILFFCPFQTWFLKNKCCCTCRIYNWDYAMMFTPLFFVKSPYTWSLLALSVLLLMRWEITFFRHPERFSDKTNAYLHCSNCSEKLCSHKKQLASLWKDIAAFTDNRLQKLR
ncbi:MAG: hypothetical protein IJJ01_03285 [Firmicutes bacterium]|nr:hypothetical protein [Bacillota bacterium]